MHRGYFALWRKFQDHPFWQEERVFSKAEAWLDILWEAQHEKESQEVSLGMRILVCKYGETLKSIRTWAKRWGWGEAKVHRFLKLLKNMRQIDTVSETVTTRITILNYKEYDPRNNKSETQMERKRNASETQAVTDKKDKHYKNDKNDIYTFWISQKIVVHKKLNNEIKSAIKTSLKSNSETDILDAIKNYSEVFKSDNHYFSYRWTLVHFLKRGLGQFLNEADPLHNYLKDEHKNKNCNQPDFDGVLL